MSLYQPYPAMLSYCFITSVFVITAAYTSEAGPYFTITSLLHVNAGDLCLMGVFLVPPYSSLPFPVYPNKQLLTFREHFHWATPKIELFPPECISKSPS